MKSRTNKKTPAKKSTAKPRRTRATSNAGKQEIVQSLFAPDLEPPAHIKLRPCDLPFWQDITSARAKVLWNDSDLAIAAELARSKADIERIRADLETEGDIIVNAKKTQVVNPKHYLLETLVRRVTLLSSKVQVNAEATTGKSNATRKVKEVEEKAKKATRPAFNDPLIPSRIQ